MSHTTQKTTVLPQVVHTPAFASIPAREAYLRSVRHPDGRLGTTPSTQTSLCCTVYSEDDHTRPQRKRTCAEENPNCDSAPWVGSSRHVGARSRRREGDSACLSQCAIAPRGMYTGDPSKSALGAGRKGTSHPVTSSQGLCVCSLQSSEWQPIPRGSVALWDAALRV